MTEVKVHKTTIYGLKMQIKALEENIHKYRSIADARDQQLHVIVAQEGGHLKGLNVMDL